MTYRELRQFTEIVRVLGYQKPVGIDSFDTPNFALMADLLNWLGSLYDPEIVVLSELFNEHGRVEFVRGIVQQLATRSGIRLNPRKLYASDRFAVRELLKIASPIYRGITSPNNSRNEVKAPDLPKAVKQKITQLSSSVPKHAVELFDQLDSEIQIRETRSRAITKQPQLDEFEKSVNSAVDGAKTRLESLTKELDRLNSEEDTLNSKIKQRRHEYERQSRRLMSVQTIRPAYMDEYEVHEQELQELFKVYFQHYRNVDYLEKELHTQGEELKKRAQDREHQFRQKKISEEKKILAQVINSHIDPIAKTGGLNPAGLDSGEDDALFTNNSSDDDKF